TNGVPAKVRTSCVARREEEGAFEVAPPECYLMLMEMREILRHNWSAFGKAMEAVSGQQGKDRATEWLVRLNDVHKVCAHPLKRLYQPVDPADVSFLRSLHTKLVTHCKRPMP